MEMFRNWANGGKSGIHPDLRSSVFGIAIKNGGVEEVPSLTVVDLTGSGKQCINLQLIKLSPLTKETQRFATSDVPPIPN
jgi:hypothetical protein